MAGAPVDTILVRVEADLSAIRAQLKEFDDRLNKSQRGAAAALTKMSNVFKLVLGAALVRELARAGLALLELGSRVEEMQAKSSVVFGRFTDDVRAELQAFGQEVGRSAFQLEEMAASVQDTFVPMGFARGEAAQLSVQLAKLATDVASFNNASDTETMVAFQSALVGNHETVRRFGIVITEATLQQELYRMGINKTSQEASNAEKVQARLNLIMAGTTDAQGDAARTADSYANQSKRLSAELENLGVAVVRPLMGDFAYLVGLLADAAKGTREWLASVGLAEKAVRPFADIVSELQAANKEHNRLSQNLASLAANEGTTDIGDAYGYALGHINPLIEKQKERIALFQKEMQQAQGANAMEGLTVEGGFDPQSAAQEQSASSAKKLGDVLKDLREENQLLNEEMDGAPETALEYTKALQGITGASIEDKEAILQLIQANAELKKSIEAKTEATKANDEANKGIADLTLQNELLRMSIAGATEAELKQYEARTLLTKANPELVKQIEMLLASNQKLTDEYERQNEVREKAANDNARINDTIIDYSDKIEVLNAKLNGATDAELELLRIRQQHSDMAPENIQNMKDLIEEHDRLTEATKRAAEQQQFLEDALARAGGQISDALVDGLMEGKVSLDDFTNFFKDFVKELIREAIRAYLIKRILGSIFGSAGGGGGSVAPPPQYMAGGGAVRGFAGGGAAPMIVGERGPELFVPHSAGSIKNNMDTKNILAGAGGGVVVNQTINVETGVSQTVRAEMLSLLPSIKQDTIQAVADARRRGGTFAQAFGG